MELIKKYLTNGQYITEVFEKRAIILHHTIGLSADSAWRWWNSTPERVGTAYIIDRDGKILECFDPKFWIYQLGLKGADGWLERRSIGIELVSAGPLRLIDNQYRFYPLWPNMTRYNVIDEKDVFRVKNMWRGAEFYHKYSDLQIKALSELILYLYEIFPAIGKDIDWKNFYQYNEKVYKDHIPGIWSHSTVRADKNDVYPDDRLIAMLKDINTILNPKPIQPKKASIEENPKS